MIASMRAILVASLNDLKWQMLENEEVANASAIPSLWVHVDRALGGDNYHRDTGRPFVAGDQ
jgi:hypothetical protein